MPALTKLQTTDALAELSDSAKQPNEQNRRALLKKAGMLLGSAGALAALNTPALATAKEGANEMDGLWQGVISAPDNSFPSFGAILMYGGGIWTGSGQVDLTLAALSSTLWGAFQRIGPRQFHGIGRFCTYDANFDPTGFATVDQINTLSADGRAYHGDGALQYFDNNGNPLGPGHRSSMTRSASPSHETADIPRGKALSGPDNFAA